MRFFVGVTDNRWYEYLARLGPDKVNFWRPSGRGFQAIEVGAPFLFKLHSLLNFVAGGGFFVKALQLPVSLAWDAFGPKNGAPNFDILLRLIRSHRGGRERDPDIGCIILNDPFFLPREAWIPAPEDWQSNIVTGKTYDTQEGSGQRLWEPIAQFLATHRASTAAEASLPGIGDESVRYGREYLRRTRLGQGAFRILVTTAYRRQCAISGEKTLPVLEAAHIKPFTNSGPNRVESGLLMRSDMHILFDRGYLTVTPDYHVEVSAKIRELFENGRAYYTFHGRQLVMLPESVDERPSRDFLEWHNTKVYQG
jgi:putative restriction endonuclease